MLADSVGLAPLVVLETLAPAERLAFVLHDMFAVPFDEIAPILGRASGRIEGSPRRAGRGRCVLRRARDAKLALVDGAAGAVWAPGGWPRVVFGFTITRGKIAGIDMLADPARLRQLDLLILGD